MQLFSLKKNAAVTADLLCALCALCGKTSSELTTEGTECRAAGILGFELQTQSEDLGYSTPLAE